MALVSWFISLYIFSLCSCENCVIDNRTPDYSWEVKLQKDIAKCAKYYIPPVQGEDAVIVVNTSFLLKNFDLDTDDVFTTYFWVLLQWYDGRLTWKPEDYGGIQETIESTFSIWTPSIKLHDSINPDELDILIGDCIILSTGYVTCACRLKHQTVCSSNLRNWPFDKQTCTQKFGEWQQHLVKVKYNFRRISMLGSEYGTGWTISGYETNVSPNESAQITITYILDREAQGFAISVVIPTIVVSVLTIISLVLDADNIRLFVSCLSLLLHYAVVQEISTFIPKHSSDTPTILLLVRSSIILTLLSILLTCFLKSVDSKERSIYAWVKSVNNYVYNSRYQYIIWPRWKRQTSGLTISEELSDNNSDDWLDLASLVNFVCVIMYLVLYSTSFILYMPSNTEL